MIDKFSRRWAFLSNYYPSPVLMDRFIYPTVEHAYQAAKTEDDEIRRIFTTLPDPHVAKALGRALRPRENWGSIKLDVMNALLRQKFAAGSELAQMLLASGDHELVEGNTWGDRFWGKVDGDGENYLGLLLMDIRRYRKSEADHE